ncbi:MAG: methionine--tRNA ligase subunit beta [Patescibacteria group bacterium]|nr:methionine--tRNA ligase subunit beta [Patescibacteria group bacterium]
MITIEDFQKIDLRVGKIEQADKINKTKLIKLIVNLGNEKRTIVAGIGNRYEPEELLGQLIVIIVNLQPKEIKGIKSEGMILAAEDEKGPVIVVPLEQVKAGTRVR